MDLNVLKGRDPCGYKAETRFRPLPDDQITEEERRKRQKKSKLISSHSADGIPYQPFTGNRRREMERFQTLDKRNDKIEDDESFRIKRETINEKLKNQAEKKREKRLKRKIKKTEKIQQNPQDQEEE